MESQGLPSVSDQCENGEREGDDLVEEKNQPKGARPSGVKDGQGFGPGVTTRDAIADCPKEKKAEAIRDEECQQSGHPELNGELNGEKQSETPYPREGD